MATFKQNDDENKPRLYVIEKAENKIMKAQRYNKNDVSFCKDDMFTSLLSVDEWNVLEEANLKATSDKKIINLFSMRSVF